MEQNGDTDVFPPYGAPVLNWATGRGTGRFFPPEARLEDSGCAHFDLWSGEEKPTLQQRAKFAAAQRREALRQEMLGKPRYRHLLIASESHFLEILCEDLPRWEWATVRVRAEEG